MVKLDFALHSLFIYYRKRFWMGVMSPIGTSYVLENPLHVIPICSSWQHSFCFHFQICVNCMITTAWFMCQWFSFGGLCKLPIVIFILFCHKLESALQVHIIKKKSTKARHILSHKTCKPPKGVWESLLHLLCVGQPIKMNELPYTWHCVT